MAETPAMAPPEATPVGETRARVVLDVRNLTTYFYTYDGVVQALEGVSLKLRRGETLGLVGETGCGKSVTAFSITRLVQEPPGRIVGGKVLFRGANLLWGVDREATFKPVKGSDRVKVHRNFRRIKAAHNRLASIRGGGIAMIFQEPGQAMNPVFSIADQVGEVILLHRGVELVDGLLAATPDAPEVPAAIERLVAAARDGDATVIATAATELGRIVNLSSFGVEANYLAKDANPESWDRLTSDLQKRLERLRLSGTQRAYLRLQRTIAENDQRLRGVYMDEMRKGEPQAGDRRRVQRSRTRLRISGFRFSLPGIKRRASKPVREETFWRVVQGLEGVRIANPVQVARGFPHELSGGMLQRVMIAMALIGNPDILLADEPTTALDVTIQAQILELMRDLRHRVGTAILLITHDLAVIAEVADRVSVMYAGQIVETAGVEDLFTRPLHPYAQGLLASIPRFDQPSKKLTSIYGSVPNLIHPPSGCRFHPRCPYAMPVCRETRPPLTDEGNSHHVACFLYTGPKVVE
ncbi:MAG TPA: ABC transporter ATP-binding protein [Thermoplasmata archaeon]|nr:ABC transporter ATP-binding protein [Thermoplasmata archaeon]